MMEDIRYAWRMVWRSPGPAAIVVLTLALGIGANTAVFSVVHGALLQSLPYKDPARLVDVLDASVKSPNLSKAFGTYSDFEEYARSAHSFEKIAFVTWAAGGATLTGRGPARNILAIPVSEDFFALLGVSAAHGRTFGHGDMSHGCSVVASHDFWRDTLASDPHFAGRTVTLNRRSCTVLGVMPASFEFYPRKTKVWMLLTPDDPRPRDQLLVISLGRLKPGVTARQAEAELAGLHKAIHPGDWQRDFRPKVNSLQDEFTFLAGRNLRDTLRLLLIAVALVLLIACLNVANLLLGRSAARNREFAVRAALGSGRARLLRQLLIEGSILACMGGLAGVLLAAAMVRYFLYANPIELPVGSNVSISVPVLLFTALLTIGTAFLFGIGPAWSGSRADVSTGLRMGGRGPSHGANGRLTRVLVAAEVSLSLVLLAGASLLMRSVLKMSAAPLGFDPGQVMVVNTTLPEQGYAKTAERLRFQDELRSRLNAIPGAELSAFATTMPPYGGGNYEIEAEGKGRTGIQDVGQDLVSADYFRVLRISLRRGRMFTQQDSATSAPVAVVNEKLAEEYFPDIDPIGRRIRAFGFKEGPWVTIVGVVATEKHPELMHEMTWHEQSAFYRPIEQDPPGYLSIAVRMHGDGFANAGRSIERAITNIDREVPVGEVSSMRTLLGGYLAYPRFRSVVIDLFAALALLLAALGLHGLLSQYVSQRRREIGVRMAMGASTWDIVRVVSVQGGAPVVAGLGIGVVLTAALTRFIASLLFDVTPADPVTMIGAPLVLVAAAFVAVAKPARDAASVDPVVALRDE
jgi:putative ABC transport system permease protein